MYDIYDKTYMQANSNSTGNNQSRIINIEITVFLHAINNKIKQENTFVVFADFQQTAKVFPTNFVSANLSANIYSKSCFRAYQKQNYESLPTL